MGGSATEALLTSDLASLFFASGMPFFARLSHPHEGSRLSPAPHRDLGFVSTLQDGRSRQQIANMSDRDNAAGRPIRYLEESF